MGKVIKKQLNGMSWWMKTSLVLLLTLATSVFMYQGWYVPKEAKAATVNYYLFGTTASSVGVDGSTTVIVAATSYSITQGATNSARAITNNTAPTQTTTNGRIQLSATATTDLTKQEMVRVYTPTYATSTTISASIASRVDAYHRTAGAGTLLVADVFEYNDTTGFVGAAKGTGSVAIANNTTAATYNVTLNNPSFAVASGNRVVVVYYFTCATGVRPAMLYGGGLNTTTPTGLTSFTLVETAAPADSTAPTAGTVTITPDITSSFTSSAPTITTQFTDAESAVTSCAYTTDGGATWPAGVVSGASSPYTCTANPTGLSAGSHNINMRATSTGGTTTATQIARTVDTTVPTDGTLSATAGNTQVTLSWTSATDTGGSGIASYVLRYATGATAPANCTLGTAVTGSPFSSATLGVTHTGLVNGTQYSYRLCANDNLGNTSGGATKSATPASGPVTTFSNCGGCHGYTTTFSDGTGRNAPAGQFQGSHSGHVITNATACSVCHTAPATTTSADYSHANGTVNMAASISGGSYVKGSAPVSNTFSPSACNTTTCHGASSPTWGSNTTNATCSKCHGVSGTSSTQYTADPKTAAPGYVSTAPVGTGRDTAGLTAATGAQVGAHDTHLRASNAISSPIACTECHSNVNTTSTTFTGHMDGAGTLSFGTLATSGAGTAPSYAGGTCSNTYCHYGRDTAYAPPATANAAVAWINTNYLTGVDTAAADCGKCHASPPLSTGTHAGGLLIADCNGCHSHVNTNGTFNNAALHINGTVEASGSCIGCHDKVQGTRSIITGASGEFGLAWGHKKSTRTAVTDSDCIVCHLEGDFTTQKAVNAPTGKHKDGNVDLRDPDGAGETAITNNSGAQFTFTKYAVAYTAGSRTTTLGNTVAEVVTAKFCLKCHDGDGALNPFARTRNATNTATTGTQYSPFEGVSTGYSVINGAAAANGVINVATQVASTNSSRHPVGAPNSRAYPYSTRLVAPYNNIGTTRNANVQTGGGTGTRVKANSVVMVCDDCHTVTTAPGSVPTLLNRTITAHGTAQVENVRGTFMVTSPTLCLSCHGTAGITANTTTSQIDSTNGDHNPGSAFTTGTTRVAAYIAQCQYCHFSAITKPARPIRAQDVHGFNGMQTTGAGWASGTVTGMRPVAFMRNVANWPAASPRPAVVVAGGTLNQIAVAAGQSTCAGTGDLGNASCSGQAGAHTNYSPGGSY